MAKYYITGVWFDADRNISYVFIHQVDKNGRWEVGEKMRLKQLMDLLEYGVLIKTMRWNYAKGAWSIGAEVQTKRSYPKTVGNPPGTKAEDRIENMMRMTAMYKNASL